MPISLTRKEMRRLMGLPEEVKEKPARKPPRRAQVTRTIEETVPAQECAVGQKYRVQKALQSHFDNPPPVGSVLLLWCILPKSFFLACEGYSMTVTRQVLMEYFVQEETEG